MSTSSSSPLYHALYESEQKYDDEFRANLNECKQAFSQQYPTNQNELVQVAAPGRVNLIGEHIDYCDGFVFPMALPLYTIIVGARNNDPSRTCRIRSLEKSLEGNSIVEFNLDNLKPLSKPLNWANYMIGVIANFQGTLHSFDAVVKSNVPLGSGLSSSAALEVSTYTLLENISNEFTKKEKKALACQKAEHEFASVPCGIMDQFISTMGIKDHALLIDCRSYESTPYPLSDPNLAILVVNSNVKHQLEGSEYSSRRQECEFVAKFLGKSSLRDASMPELESRRSELSEISYKRAHHVIGEIERTVQAAKALTENNIELLGALMNQSHDSLRDDFNVSCKELDSLVEIARRSSGVYGSRMTGGGFGGCTVTLVKKENVDELIKNIISNYSGVASFYVCRPCDGAKRVE